MQKHHIKPKFSITSLLLMTFLLAGFVCFSQRTLVPDANFRKALLDKHRISADDDNTILNSEAIAITSLNVSSRQISDLTGIEAFTALTILQCSNNKLTTLDFSANTALTTLWCTKNKLTTINLSANTALIELNCHFNKLVTLDVSANTALTKLYCENNELVTLDVSVNTALTELYCSINQLATLDASANTALITLSSSLNQLDALDVSANTALTTLSCYSNQLTTLNVSANTSLITLACHSNQLDALDVSANTTLAGLDCDNNQLTSLNVKNGNNTNFYVFSATGNPNLTCIQVDDAAWSTANWDDKDSTANYRENCTSLTIIDIVVDSNGNTIYPNPTQGVLNITVTEKADYRLLNIRGQVLKRGVLSKGNNSTVDINFLPKGIYLLNVKTSRSSFTKKVIRNEK